MEYLSVASELIDVIVEVVVDVFVIVFFGYKWIVIELGIIEFIEYVVADTLFIIIEFGHIGAELVHMHRNMRMFYQSVFVPATGYLRIAYEAP